MEPHSLRHAVEAARARFGRIDVGYYGPADFGTPTGDITTLDGAGAEEALRGVAPAVEFASLLIPEPNGSNRGRSGCQRAGGLAPRAASSTARQPESRRQAVAVRHVIRRPFAEIAEPDGREETVILEVDQLGPTQRPDGVFVGQIPSAASANDVHAPPRGQIVLERSGRPRITHLYLDEARRTTPRHRSVEV